MPPHSVHTEILLPRNDWWFAAKVHNDDSRTILAGHGVKIKAVSGSTYLNVENCNNADIAPTLGYAADNIAPDSRGIVIMIGYANSLKAGTAFSVFGTWLKADTNRKSLGRWEPLLTPVANSVAWAPIMNLGYSTTSSREFSAFIGFRRR